MDGGIVKLITENEETPMKKLIVAFALLASFSASAFNANIGYPVAAARISLTGKVVANIDCATKEIEIHDSTNEIFTRHIKANKSVMCYKDDNVYNVTFKYERGSKVITNLLTTQPNRFLPKHNTVEMM